MSSRAPSPTAQGSNFRDDDRRRDEAKIATLQNQIDELRQAIRELINRQGRDEEQLKVNEGGVEQMRLALEQIRQEARQIAQARAIDENRTRQQVSDMEGRLDDAIRPIRSLQAHVHELLEASRQKTDDTGQTQKRFEELRSMIEHLSAHGDRTAVISHQLRDSIDLLRGESDGLRRDVLRAEDQIKIVDQESRRRVTEVAQVSENYAARFDEIRSDLAHLYDIIDETRRSIVHIDPALEELRQADDTLRQEQGRFQAQTQERQELMLQHTDDLRQESDVQFAELRQAQEQRAERIGERIEELQQVQRELGFRLNALVQQLDELRQVDADLRRDLWHLHEQRVRLRLEQAQQELDAVTAQRRTSGDQPADETRTVRRAPDYLG